MKNIEQIKSNKLDLLKDISLTQKQKQTKALFYNHVIKILNAGLTEKNLLNQLQCVIKNKKIIDNEWRLKITLNPKLDMPKIKREWYGLTMYKEYKYAEKILNYILGL